MVLDYNWSKENIAKEKWIFEYFTYWRMNPITLTLGCKLMINWVISHEH